MVNPRIGVALGAGGAKGLAHIGVLQVLQESGLYIAQVSGTSIGAIIGAMYSETLDAFEIQSRFKTLIESDLYKNSGLSRLVKNQDREASFWDQVLTKIRERLALNLAQSRQALFKSERLLEALQMLIHINDFRQGQFPFIAVATDLLTGNEIPMCTGDLLQAVLSSASIPGYFPPVPHQKMLLSDGAICCPVPVHYARCCDPSIIIGSATPPRLQEHKPIQNAVEIMIRSEEINNHYLSKLQMLNADVQIYPETNNVQWNEFERLDEMVERGREAAQAVLPQIKKALISKSPWWRQRLYKLKLAR